MKHTWVTPPPGYLKMYGLLCPDWCERCHKFKKPFLNGSCKKGNVA